MFNKNGVKKLVRVLMERDGLTKEDAIEQVKHGLKDIEHMLENGPLHLIEDQFMSEFGLEPDYLFEILV